VTDFTYKNHNRLSIIDPNNSANDIAGGSSNAGTVLSHFARAHQVLTQRMALLAHDPNKAGQSLLQCIMGGNYSSFENQRNYLELLTKPGYRPPPRVSSRPADHNSQNSRPSRNYRPGPQRPSSHGRNDGGPRRRR
jgi:non-canonical poly(A) RNA polymerase PAPD5/7